MDILMGQDMESRSSAAPDVGSPVDATRVVVVGVDLSFDDVARLVFKSLAASVLIGLAIGVVGGGLWVTLVAGSP